MITKSLSCVCVALTIFVIVGGASVSNELQVERKDYEKSNVFDEVGPGRWKVKFEGAEIADDNGTACGQTKEFCKSARPSNVVRTSLKEGEVTNEQSERHGGKLERNSTVLDEFGRASKRYNKYGLAVRDLRNVDYKNRKNTKSWNYLDTYETVDETRKKIRRRDVDSLTNDNQLIRRKYEVAKSDYYAKKKAIMERFYARQQQIKKKYGKEERKDSLDVNLDMNSVPSTNIQRSSVNNVKSETSNTNKDFEVSSSATRTDFESSPVSPTTRTDFESSPVSPTTRTDFESSPVSPTTRTDFESSTVSSSATRTDLESSPVSPTTRTDFESSTKGSSATQTEETTTEPNSERHPNQMDQPVENLTENNNLNVATIDYEYYSLEDTKLNRVSYATSDGISSVTKTKEATTESSVDSRANRTSKSVPGSSKSNVVENISIGYDYYTIKKSKLHPHTILTGTGNQYDQKDELESGRSGVLTWGTCKGRMLYQHNLLLNADKSKQMDANLTVSIDGPFCVTCARLIPMTKNVGNITIHKDEKMDNQVIARFEEIGNKHLWCVMKLWVVDKISNQCIYD